MILDLCIIERADELEQLRMRIPTNDPKAYLIAADHELTVDGRRFFVFEIEDDRSGTETTKAIEANALWYRLNDPTRVGSVVLAGVDPKTGLKQILTGTGWTAGEATVYTSNYVMEQEDKTPLSLIRTWAKITGTLPVFDTLAKTVDLVASRGANRGMSFRYRRNLVNVRRRIRPPEATVLYPYGAQGLNIAGINAGLQYLEDFSYYTGQGLTIDEARARFTRSRVWSDRTFLVDTELLAAAQARLALLAAPTVTYETDVVDLSALTGNVETVELYDTVQVSDPELGIDLTTTVVARTTYPLEPWRNRVELGNTVDVLADSSTSSRLSQAEDWTMFVSDNSFDLAIRNDADWITNRIPLLFREGGEAHWHLDLFVTGVGAGVFVAEVYDGQTGLTVYRSQRLNYTNGAVVHAFLQWAEVDRNGQYDYRVRLTTEASGGASSTNGVDLLNAEARFFVLARGAVRQAPTGPSEAVYLFTGTPQYFTVPANVTEVEIECIGGAGGGTSTAGGGGGAGGKVTATFPVVPGNTYDVIVGGQGTDYDSGGAGRYPNGGSGGTGPGVSGAGGGGASYVTTAGGTLAGALIVAGAGGGSAAQGPSRRMSNGTGQVHGGNGGLFAGTAGNAKEAIANAPAPGTSGGGGATQFAGGAKATGATDPSCTDGSISSAGGNGGHGENSGGASFVGGGGGGGWCGGGGGGDIGVVGGGFYGGDGGGGSGYVAPTATDISIVDGFNDPTGAAANTHHGTITFRWDDPL